MRRTLVWVLPVMLILSITGCTPTPEGTQSPYSAEIEQAKQVTTSEFEEGAFADSVLDRQEYEEAVQRYVDCLNSAGLNASSELQENGSYSYAIGYASGNGNVASDAETTCAVGTKDLIEPLYVSMIVNPDNRDPVELIVECLVRHGVVDSSYDGEDLEKELSETPEFRPENPDAYQCVADPTG